MPSLYETMREKSRIRDIRTKLLGKEFRYGTVVGIIVAVSEDATACTFIGLRWHSPHMFRWARIIPARYRNGVLKPARLARHRFGEPPYTPLPNHTPRHYGTHNFL